jgi:hypothetical protein
MDLISSNQDEKPSTAPTPPPQTPEDETREAFRLWRQNRKCWFFMPTSPHASRHYVSIEDLPPHELLELAHANWTAMRHAITGLPHSLRNPPEEYAQALDGSSVPEEIIAERRFYSNRDVRRDTRGFIPRPPEEYFEAMKAAEKIEKRHKRSHWKRRINRQSKNPLKIVSWESRVLRRWEVSAKQLLELEEALVEGKKWKVRFLLWQRDLGKNEYVLEKRVMGRLQLQCLRELGVGMGLLL